MRLASAAGWRKGNKAGEKFPSDASLPGSPHACGPREKGPGMLAVRISHGGHQGAVQ